jgi:hypothetical protein
MEMILAGRTRLAQEDDYISQFLQRFASGKQRQMFSSRTPGCDPHLKIFTQIIHAIHPLIISGRTGIKSSKI